MSRGAGDRVDVLGEPFAARRFIAIGIPTFGLVNVFWASRLFGQLRHPMNCDVRVIPCLGREVAVARNEIVAHALADDASGARRCSHVLFVDDDVLVHPDLLLKLLDDGRPIVAGLYFAKTTVPQPLMLRDESRGVVRDWTPGELVECYAHGMGATLIDADVFRRLRDETDLGTDELGHPAWFRTTRDAAIVRPDGVAASHNQTEDVYFLRRAAALGYQPTVDTSPPAFAFHWAQQEQRAYPLAQWREYQDKGTITWPRADGRPPVVWQVAA